MVSDKIQRFPKGVREVALAVCAVTVLQYCTATHADCPKDSENEEECEN